MAFIRMIPENEAEGKLKQLYNLLTNGKADGNVAHILKVHSLHPEAMEAHLNLYRTIMFGPSGLTRSQREMIATTVSAANSCMYWTKHHGAALRRESNNKDLQSAISKDYKQAAISEAERAMLEYAEKLTRKPYTIKRQDIDKLHKVGFNDRDIFDINQIVAYFNYVNRIADGLGVELEESYKER